jgi:hypothetical protein
VAALDAMLYRAGAPPVLEPDPDLEVEPESDLAGRELELEVPGGAADEGVSGLGVDGVLSQLSVPKDSFRLIQLLSVKVTFLYFALPEE